MRGIEDDKHPLISPTDDEVIGAAALSYEPYNLPKKTLSHSQIDMYMRCPRQYEFRYIKDIKKPPRGALALGTSTHAALEFTHHHIVDHGVPASTEQLLDAYSTKWDEAIQEIPEEMWKQDEEDPGQVKDSGITLVKLYNAKHAQFVRPHVETLPDGRTIRGIEKEFNTSVGDVPVTGYIDLIDTNDPTAVMTREEYALLQSKGQDIPVLLRTALADVKTKSKSMTQSDVDGSLQLTMYSYVEKVPNVRFDQLLKQKNPQFKQLKATRTEQDYRWLIEVVTSVARAISAGIFPPCNPSGWTCSAKWCGYYNECRGKRV
jgi:hypothetical protein